MTDLKLKYTFTDRGGSKVYDVIDPRQTHFCAGQVRIPPDPRMAELEAENVSLSRMVTSQDEGLAELEARSKEFKITIETLNIEIQMLEQMS